MKTTTSSTEVSSSKNLDALQSKLDKVTAARAEFNSKLDAALADPKKADLIRLTVEALAQLIITLVTLTPTKVDDMLAKVIIAIMRSKVNSPNS